MVTANPQQGVEVPDAIQKQEVKRPEASTRGSATAPIHTPSSRSSAEVMVPGRCVAVPGGAAYIDYDRQPVGQGPLAPASRLGGRSTTSMSSTAEVTPSMADQAALTGDENQPLPVVPPLEAFWRLHDKLSDSLYPHVGMGASMLDRAFTDIPAELRGDVALDMAMQQMGRLLVRQNWLLDALMRRELDAQRNTQQADHLRHTLREAITTQQIDRDRTLDGFLKLRERRAKIAHLENMNCRDALALAEQSQKTPGKPDGKAPR